MFENLPHPLNLVLSAIILGICATAIMDIWALFLKITFDVSGLNLSMLGRWVGHLFKGKLLHSGIGNSAAISGEATIGWLAHYFIGVTFALVLVLAWGPSWLQNPTLGPALIVGLVTLIFPYFLMQPSFGMGFAASKLPDSHIIQMKSFMAHFIYGLGLYFSAKLMNKLL